MGARLVLLAFILVDALVGIAMSPAHGWIAPLDEWIWDGLTLGTFAVLLGLEYPAQLLADRLGIQGQTVVVALLGVICLLIAAFAIVRLVRKDGRGKAGAMFLLMLAVDVPAAVILTLYEVTRFGH
jgi:hypothetical protein